MVEIVKQFILSLVVFISIFPSPGLLLPQTIKIGGLFDIWDPYEETAFRHAAERVNADPNAFPMYGLGAVLEKVQMGDSYNASKKVCELLREGVGGLIGPQTPTTASHVQSVCEVFNIPRIDTKWDFRGSHGDFLINLYPHPHTLSTAYADVIKDWGWSTVVIIYENNESLVRLQGIFELTGKVIHQFVVKQLPTEEDDYRPLMKDLRTNYGTINHIIIDCQSAKLPKIFQDAESEKMMTHDHNYFVTSLDIHILDRREEAFTSVNVTGYRLVDPGSAKLQVILESWRFRSAVTNRRTNYFGEDPFQSGNFPKSPSDMSIVPNLTYNTFFTETALMYDAMELFALGLHEPSEMTQGGIRPESLNCDASSIYRWNQGAYFMQTLKQVNFHGLSGDIHIDPDGKRRKFKLEVMELSNQKFSKIGDWSPLLPRRLNWTRDESETQKSRIDELKGITLNVTTKPSSPYVTFYENGTYEGYAVDLIDILAKEFHFEYEFHKVADGNMGSRNNASKYGWDGLVGEILDGRANLAIGDMSITSARASVIDFSLPFMNIGISILYKKPEKSAPNLFSFLAPFHYEVWIYMATAYLGVSLILFTIARAEPGEWQVTSVPDSSEDVLENPFSLLNVHWLVMGSLMTAGCDVMPKISPYEWLNPHPCVESPDELELTLHLTNSLWFTIGTLMQQGSDIAPKAGSTRMVAGIWWFFTLIMISSYTANLAAFLTSEGMVEGIKDIKDLPKQTKVKYGTLQSGSTRSFFKDSKFPLYAEIGKNMDSMSPEPHVKSTQEGVEKVRKSNGGFAFFMESAGIEYAMQRDCSLVQLGIPLDSKGFGIGFKKGSKFRDAFNIKLLDLAQSGKLEELKKKWWEGGICKTEMSSSTGAQPLTLGHVGGVFVVLLGGCVMAVIMVVFEFMWKARKLAKDDESSIWSEIWKELKFALQCHNETKPIKKSQSINPTINQSESVPYLAFNSRDASENGGGRMGSSN